MKKGAGLVHRATLLADAMQIKNERSREMQSDALKNWEVGDVETQGRRRPGSRTERWRHSRKMEAEAHVKRAASSFCQESKVAM